MIVRRIFLAVAALCALLAGAACGIRENAPLGAETDDPLFVQGKQLEKQSRHPEALAVFLKLIDRRGERASAESHLESGLIYLNHTKDPVEAYHHFRKYLELQPNSKEAPYVRGMVDVARREFARTLSARPLEDQSVRLEIAEEVAKLRRENEELKAELAARRGVAPLPRASLVVPDFANTNSVPPPVTKVVDSPITPAPMRAAGFAGTPAAPQSAAPRAVASVPAAAPRTAAAAPTTQKALGKTHTVVPGDTFYNLSKRYGVRMEALAAANGLSVNSPLRLGTVLKIP